MSKATKIQKVKIDHIFRLEHWSFRFFVLYYGETDQDDHVHIIKFEVFFG